MYVIITIEVLYTDLTNNSNNNYNEGNVIWKGRENGREIKSFSKTGNQLRIFDTQKHSKYIFLNFSVLG